MMMTYHSDSWSGRLSGHLCVVPICRCDALGEMGVLCALPGAGGGGWRIAEDSLQCESNYGTVFITAVHVGDIVL